VPQIPAKSTGYWLNDIAALLPVLSWVHWTGVDGKVRLFLLWSKLPISGLGTDPIPHTRMQRSAGVPLELIAPFGPCIGRFQMHLDVCEVFDRYIERMAGMDVPAHLDHGPRLVGAVTQEITVPAEMLAEDAEFRNVVTFLRDSVVAYVRAAWGRVRQDTDEAADLRIQVYDWDVWIVRQFAGEYNPLHTHSDYQISGVGYLKVPSAVLQRRARRDKRSKDGALHLVHGASQFLCDARFLVRPMEGVMLVFPSHLMHVVYPFLGTEERRSVAFNVRVTLE
jgi:Putative 2OG-Fe(II) oxygenase